jgi:hypothetical protein
MKWTTRNTNNMSYLRSRLLETRVTRNTRNTSNMSYLRSRLLETDVTCWAVWVLADANLGVVAEKTILASGANSISGLLHKSKPEQWIWIKNDHYIIINYSLNDSTTHNAYNKLYTLIIQSISGDETNEVIIA